MFHSIHKCKRINQRTQVSVIHSPGMRSLQMTRICMQSCSSSHKRFSTYIAFPILLLLIKIVITMFLPSIKTIVVFWKVGLFHDSNPSFSHSHYSCLLSKPSLSFIVMNKAKFEA